MLKKGFTLVELLIVIVVIAILTSITFRIMGAGESQTKRNTTVLRLHALESAIGGYYAAFGSYPPVRLHGSRNIFCKLNDQGIQIVDEPPEDGKLDEAQVLVACRSQPVAMLYPFRKGKDGFVWDAIEQTSKLIQELQRKGFDSYGLAGSTSYDALRTPNQLSSKYDEAEWTHCNLFKFGLMSFLLPRFIFMMQGPDASIYDKFAQWGDNNNVPCKFEDGIPYDSWEKLAQDIMPDGNKINRDAWKVALLPSQIVTARWVACFEGMCTFMSGVSGCTSVWGVELAAHVTCPLSEAGFTVLQHNPARYPPVFSSGNLQSEHNGFTQAYALDGVTVWDGWDEEFFYYSPPPHQGYRLWSAGENSRTFPPWITEDEIDKILSPDDAKTARGWKADDIVHMNN